MGVVLGEHPGGPIGCMILCTISYLRAYGLYGIVFIILSESNLDTMFDT